MGPRKQASSMADTITRHEIWQNKHTKRDQPSLEQSERYIVALLKACAQQKDLQTGATLHADILKKGLIGKNCFVASTLTHMYVKCGALARAAEVLDELPLRDVVSWSALIAGYAQERLGKETLVCFQCMQSEGLSPDAITFGCILKACGHIGAAEKGQQIHGEIMRQGLLRKDVMLGNSLLDMYTKCGELAKAVQLLNQLQIRDVVSWNIVTAGYVQHGRGVEAFEFYSRMQFDGILPDAVSFICILKACISIQSVDKGKQIHQKIVSQDLLKDNTVLGNTLVDMYSKCGAIVMAAEVFDELLLRDVVSWNTLISGYTLQSADKEALKCFDRMQSEGLFPNAVTFLCILRACSSIGALEKGKEIHDEIVRCSLLDKHIALGTALVDMYVKCGAPVKASSLLEELSIRDAVAWNALITGYAQGGHSEEALECFKQMQNEGLCPDAVTLASMSKTCGSIGALDIGEQIYQEAIRQGLLVKDSLLGNSLVEMYATCGALAKATKLFHELPVQDVVSWNALLAGHLQQGHRDEALKCFEQMQSNGIHPNVASFIYALKACGGVRGSEKGEQIHHEIERAGILEKDVMLGTALVYMYGKCGMLAKAVEIMRDLCIQDVVSWNALITGCVQQGQCKVALDCFEWMQSQGLIPDTVTFICILAACGSENEAGKGEEVHKEIVRKGLLESDVVLGNALVDMYAKWGAVEQAAKVLDVLPIRDAVSWNSLITGYAKQGLADEALGCYKQMHLEGIAPDTVSLICVLKACGIMGDSEQGELIHAEAVRQGLFGKNIVLGNSLVDMYAKCSALAKAGQVLEELSTRDVISFNAIIAGYVQQLKGDEALKCFGRMYCEGLFPNEVTFICILKACGNIGAFDKGITIHDEVRRQRLLDNDVAIGSALVDMYSKCGALAKAARVLYELPVGDIVPWNALISGFVQQEQGEEALETFEQMQIKGLIPNRITYICVLKACGNIGATVKGQQFHNEIQRLQLLEQDSILGNALVDMYAKCGAIGKAARVLCELPVRDVVSWNILVTGFARIGHGKEALKCVEQMCYEGVSPDAVTLSSVLTACSHCGLLEEGQSYFASMSTKYGITPAVEHYTCIVDLLGSVGELDNAFTVIMKMPSLHCLPVWHSLLGACQECGNVNLGRLAFNTAVQIDKDQAVACLND